MGLTLQNEIQLPSNAVGHRDVILAAATGDAGDFAYGLNPRKATAIAVSKPTSGATVSLSNTVFKKDGSRITSIDDADILWIIRSTGIEDFFVGDEKGLTFMKVESTLDATGTDIEISVSQF